MTLSIGVNEVTRQIVLDIPKLSHAEAGKLAQNEYERVLALIETLSGNDWDQPTYCTEWRVREMVAHLAGSVAGSSSFAAFKHQNIDNPYAKEFADPTDATNKLQVEEREVYSLSELVAEFRQKGQIAVNNRKNLPWIVRKIHLPMGSLGFTSFEYLMDTIYPRDQWMHRYDICAATSREMITTAEHDGRIVALVLRDIAKKLRKSLSNRTIVLRLIGDAGGEYQFGRNATPDAILEIDVFDFNLRSSGRISVDEAAGKTAVSGDYSTAKWFLENCEVVY